MPELPDIQAYIYALQTRIVEQPIERIRVQPVSASHSRTFY